MSLIFLTSTGFSDEHISKVFAEKTITLKYKSVCIIVNAANGGKENKYALIQYTSQLAASVLTRELLPFSRWQTTYDDHITRHS
jgi:hypothetical protein